MCVTYTSHIYCVISGQYIYCQQECMNQVWHFYTQFGITILYTLYQLINVPCKESEGQLYNLPIMSYLTVLTHYSYEY